MYVDIHVATAQGGPKKPQVLPNGAIAVEECQTITEPGSYELVANLSAAGDCLMLGANNISINLGNFTISGDGTGSGAKKEFGSKPGAAWCESSTGVAASIAKR